MRPQEQKPKIFGIGLNKTGTTTLGEMGKILGLRCTSCNKKLLEDVVLRGDFERVKELVQKFDLFEDWPWPLIYKELDELFPGSKFIMTTRSNEEVWLRSLKKHSLKTSVRGHCRKLAYGFNYPHGNEIHHKNFYTTHIDEARAYFAGRDDDYLELCWENGDGFEELCPFLGVDTPSIAVPHANKADDTNVGTIRLLANKAYSLLNI